VATVTRPDALLLLALFFVWLWLRLWASDGSLLHFLPLPERARAETNLQGASSKTDRFDLLRSKEGETEGERRRNGKPESNPPPNHFQFHAKFASVLRDRRATARKGKERPLKVIVAVANRCVLAEEGWLFPFFIVSSCLFLMFATLGYLGRRIMKIKRHASKKTPQFRFGRALPPPRHKEGKKSITFKAGVALIS
jgi:hypothetical protein